MNTVKRVKSLLVMLCFIYLIWTSQIALDEPDVLLNSDCSTSANLHHLSTGVLRRKACEGWVACEGSGFSILCTVLSFVCAVLRSISLNC